MTIISKIARQNIWKVHSFSSNTDISGNILKLCFFWGISSLRQKIRPNFDLYSHIVCCGTSGTRCI